jgi:hypothetical protein
MLIFIALITLFIFSPSCGQNEGKSDANDSVGQFLAKSFSVADYNFAILQDKKFLPYNKAIYHRGDEIYLVLENVGPFGLGSDSLNHADMKLEVTDAIGQQIVLRDSLFGERGHGKFINNMLASPYGSYTSGLKDLPGKYTICITVYDLVRNDSLVVCDDFFIE